MKKNLVKLLPLLLLSVSLVACGGSKAEDKGTGASTEKAQEQNASSDGENKAEASASGQKDSFTNIIDGDPGNTLNPLTADDRYTLMTCHAAYAPAYHIYGDGTVDYILAESMTASEDGLTLTMKLKPDLKWSDGEALTADDIVFTYDTINSLSKHIFEGKENTDVSLLEDKVVGAGPYVLEEYKTGEYLKFKANPNYAKGKPYIDTLIYRVIDKGDTATLAMQNGEAEAMVLSPDMIEPYLENDAFTLYNYSEGRVPYIRLNTASDNMQDKTYRSGIFHALNREEIMKAAYGDPDYYHLGYSFLPYDNQFYTEDVEKWDQDLEKSKEEVKNGPKKLTLLYPANTPILEREALAIQAECKAVGVDVELASLADAAYYKATKDLENKDYDIFLGGYVMGSDPDTFSILFSTEKDNNMNYHNAEIDKLFREGNSTLDLEKRKEIYNKVQRLVTEEAIYYPLGTNLRTLVTKKDVDPEEAQLVPIYTFGDLSKLKFK